MDTVNEQYRVVWDAVEGELVADEIDRFDNGYPVL